MEKRAWLAVGLRDIRWQGREAGERGVIPAVLLERKMGRRRVDPGFRLKKRKLGAACCDSLALTH